LRPIVLPAAPSMVTPGSVLFGAAATALLVAAAALAPRGSGQIKDRHNLTEGVRYLLPLLPPRKKSDAAGMPVLANLTWGGGLAPRTGQGTPAAGGGEIGSGRGQRGLAPGRTTGTSPLPLPDSEPVGGQVYVASQLDRRVERDPESKAPLYPPFLESQHIEGSVVVSYVVDTTGLADSASLRVQTMTHPAFVESIRAALPGMRFHPAELSGRPVRQLVVQEFRFVIVPAPEEPAPHGDSKHKHGSKRPAPVPEGHS
jgi:TonB family protein